MQVVRKLGFPISLVYAVVVYLRNCLYTFGFFKSTSFKTPTICVGNLSVGGTGKTPMIEFLLSRLEANYKLAVLSRGYKRKSKGFVLADKSVKVEDLGDEPYQIFSKFPNSIVVVDSNRTRAITILEKDIKPQLILLDDAFQHRKVSCGFSILLTDYSNLYVDDWYLPMGNLRDSVSEAKRASVIIVTKCPEKLNQIEQKQIAKKLKPLLHQQILFSYLDYNNEIKGINNIITLKDLKGKKVVVVTGIARPKPLLTFLTNEGINVQHLEYNDHHFFTQQEINLLNTKELILTTEKDFVRLKGRVNNLFYITISHKFIGDGEQRLMKSLLKFIN